MSVNNSEKPKYRSVFFSAEMDNDGEFIPLISDDVDDVDFKMSELPNELPILPLRNTVLFPGVILPITVGRQKSIRLINEANKGDKIIGTVAQKDARVNEPEEEDIYRL
ncbi:MAG TPA: LON peptidase substrate-binding domain-containing protein, partial [Bacteroidales bacterium]|nr:LON peptidase substrate-binding domain-containing protein [Bacteroidales bacterium]